MRARRHAQARASHGVEEIFYGSTPVYFAPAAGTAEAFSYADATFAPTAANTMARSNPLIAAIDPEGPPAASPIQDYPEPAWWTKSADDGMQPHLTVDMFKASKAAVAFLRHQKESEDIKPRAW